MGSWGVRFLGDDKFRLDAPQNSGFTTAKDVEIFPGKVYFFCELCFLLTIFKSNNKLRCLLVFG